MDKGLIAPKWKNPDSGVPSLMAADKPCLQLQPSLGGPPILRGGPPLGTICMDHLVSL